MPPEHTQAPAAPLAHKSKLWMILAIIAILLSVGLGVALWYTLTQQKPESTSNSTNNNQTSSGEQTPTTEQISALMRIAAANQQSGELVDVFIFDMTAPKAWRTVNTTRSVSSAGDPLIDTGNEFALQLRAVAEDAKNLPSGDGLLAENIIEVRDITDWLKDSDAESTAAQRQKAFDYIASLAASSEPKQMTSDNNGMRPISEGLVGGPFLKAQGITSTDGSLKGVAYLSIGVQAISYDPAAFVVMTGTVNGKKVLLNGRFDVRDAAYKTYASSQNEGAVAKALDAFKKGDVPADAQEIYLRVVTAAKTMTVKKQ